MAEHCVKLIFPLSDGDQGTHDEREEIFEFEDRLTDAIDSAGTGEFDGNEFGEGECTLYMYGPDADALFSSIESVVRVSNYTKGMKVYKRYGSADDLQAKEETFDL